jgi:hypothetical protein
MTSRVTDEAVGVDPAKPGADESIPSPLNWLGLKVPGKVSDGQVTYRLVREELVLECLVRPEKLGGGWYAAASGLVVGEWSGGGSSPQEALDKATARLQARAKAVLQVLGCLVLGRMESLDFLWKPELVYGSEKGPWE